MMPVRGLLKAHWDHFLPIDPVKIAEELGYELRVFPVDGSNNSNLSGMACSEDGKQVIYIKPDEFPTRKRFTLAHEIAHHVLGHTAYGKCCRDNEHTISTPEEVVANEFAAQMLMPQDIVEMLVRREGITDINELAEIFGVSESAMYYRLKNIGMI